MYLVGFLICKIKTKIAYRCSFNPIQTLRCNEIKLVYFICNYTTQRCNVSVSWLHVSQTNKCKRTDYFVVKKTDSSIVYTISIIYIYIYIYIIRSISDIYIYYTYLCWDMVQNNFDWNKVKFCAEMTCCFISYDMRYGTCNSQFNEY